MIMWMLTLEVAVVLALVLAAELASHLHTPAQLGGWTLINHLLFLDDQGNLAT
jgi:hypothetical protein